MRSLIIGVGDCRVSSCVDSVMVTYALGSCVGLTVYDPVERVGGLLHFMLPDSAMDAAKAARNPYMFADTGIPLLFKGAYRLGAHKQRLVVTACGGAQMFDDAGVFNIGRRNCEAMRNILGEARVHISAEDVGGLESRTIRLEIASGKVSVHNNGGPARSLLSSSKPTAAMGSSR